METYVNGITTGCFRIRIPEDNQEAGHGLQASYYRRIQPILHIRNGHGGAYYETFLTSPVNRKQLIEKLIEGRLEPTLFAHSDVSGSLASEDMATHIGMPYGQRPRECTQAYLPGFNGPLYTPAHIFDFRDHYGDLPQSKHWGYLGCCCVQVPRKLSPCPCRDYVL